MVVEGVREGWLWGLGVFPVRIKETEREREQVRSKTWRAKLGSLARDNAVLLPAAGPPRCFEKRKDEDGGRKL
jgi:hypothetical protein